MKKRMKMISRKLIRCQKDLIFKTCSIFKLHISAEGQKGTKKIWWKKEEEGKEETWSYSDHEKDITLSIFMFVQICHRLVLICTKINQYQIA